MNSYQNNYLPLDLPFNQNPHGVNSGISALNDLYPGRPMTIFGRYYEYEIPNEDPEGAEETYLTNRRETKEYAQNLQNMTLSEGGGDRNKVLVHAIDDPSSVIDNPALQGNAVQIPPTQNDGRPFVVPPVVGSGPNSPPTPDIVKAEELEKGMISPDFINPLEFNRMRSSGSQGPPSGRPSGATLRENYEGPYNDPKINNFEPLITPEPTSRWTDLMVLIFILVLIFIPFVMYGFCALR